MAGDANAVNQGKHPEGRRPPIPPTAIPPCQPRQHERKQRQPKKRMRKPAMQFNGSQPVIGKNLSPNNRKEIHVRKNCPKRSGKNSDLALALREKPLPNQSPSDSVSDGIHFVGGFAFVAAGFGVCARTPKTGAQRLKPYSFCGTCGMTQVMP